MARILAVPVYIYPVQPVSAVVELAVSVRLGKFVCVSGFYLVRAAGFSMAVIFIGLSIEVAALRVNAATMGRPKGRK